MADNKTIDNGANTDFTIATDEIGGVDHQYVKVEWGADGTATPVTSSAPLPITAISTPAAARTSDSIAVALQYDKLMNNLTAVSPQFAAVSCSSSGNNTILAAQGAGNMIVVHQAFLVATSAVTIKWQSGAGGTDLTGAAAIAANGGYVLPFSPIGWFRTATNTLLNLSLGGAIQVSGCIVYSVMT